MNSVVGCWKTGLKGRKNLKGGGLLVGMPREKGKLENEIREAFILKREQ